MPVILLRHTRPDIAEGICYGRLDLPLAASFASVANEVVTSLPVVDRVISSPLQRCRILAERIGAARNLPVEIESRLQEMNFGSWEGLAWDALPRTEVDAWAADFLHARPHGGESVAMLRTRTISALNDIKNAGKRCVVITHAGVIRAALANGESVADYNVAIDFGESITLPF